MRLLILLQVFIAIESCKSEDEPNTTIILNDSRTEMTIERGRNLNVGPASELFDNLREVGSDGNDLDFDYDDGEDSLKGGMKNPDMKEQEMQEVLLKAMRKPAIRKQIGEVIPILRVMSPAQRLTLAALVSSQITSQNTLSEENLLEMAAMFANKNIENSDDRHNITEHLLLPISMDIAKMFKGLGKEMGRNLRQDFNKPIDSVPAESNIRRDTRKSEYKSQVSDNRRMDEENYDQFEESSSTNKPMAQALKQPGKDECDYFTKSLCLEVSNYPTEAIILSLKKNQDIAQTFLTDFEGELLREGGHEFRNQGNGRKLERRQDDQNEVQDFASDGGYMCPSVVKYARPKRARTTSGQWKYIVNAGDYTQTLRLEICHTPRILIASRTMDMKYITVPELRAFVTVLLEMRITRRPILFSYLSTNYRRNVCDLTGIHNRYHPIEWMTVKGNPERPLCEISSNTAGPGIRKPFGRKPKSPCSYVTNHLNSQCTQIYNYHRLLTWDENKGLHMDIFKVPSCCSCHIQGYSTFFPPSKDFTFVEKRAEPSEGADLVPEPQMRPPYGYLGNKREVSQNTPNGNLLPGSAKNYSHQVQDLRRNPVDHLVPPGPPLPLENEGIFIPYLESTYNKKINSPEQNRRNPVQAEYRRIVSKVFEGTDPLKESTLSTEARLKGPNLKYNKPQHSEIVSTLSLEKNPIFDSKNQIQLIKPSLITPPPFSSSETLKGNPNDVSVFVTPNPKDLVFQSGTKVVTKQPSQYFKSEFLDTKTLASRVKPSYVTPPKLREESRISTTSGPAQKSEFFTTGGQKKINYNYHPIIDFFLSDSKKRQPTFSSSQYRPLISQDWTPVLRH